MDFSRLRTGEKIVGIGGVLLLISLWLSWYGLDINIPDVPGFEVPGGVDTTANAWQAFDLIDLLLFLTSIIAIAHVILTATGSAPALPVAGSVVATGAGALATLLVLFRIIVKPDTGLDQVDLTLKFGIFIGLIGAAAIAYGGWRAMQDEESPGMTQPAIEDRPAPAAPPAAPPPVTDPAPAAAAPPGQDAGAVPEGAPPAPDTPPSDRPA